MNATAQVALAIYRLGRCVDVRMNHARGYDVELDGRVLGHMSAEDFSELCKCGPFACDACGMPLHHADGKILRRQVVDVASADETWQRTKMIREHFECCRLDEDDKPPAHIFPPYTGRGP